jgi:hypothetical protein
MKRGPVYCTWMVTLNDCRIIKTKREGNNSVRSTALDSLDHCDDPGQRSLVRLLALMICLVGVCFPLVANRFGHDCVSEQWLMDHAS